MVARLIFTSILLFLQCISGVTACGTPTGLTFTPNPVYEGDDIIITCTFDVTGQVQLAKLLTIITGIEYTTVVDGCDNHPNAILPEFRRRITYTDKCDVGNINGYTSGNVLEFKLTDVTEKENNTCWRCLLVKNGNTNLMYGYLQISKRVATTTTTTAAGESSTSSGDSATSDSNKGTNNPNGDRPGGNVDDESTTNGNGNGLIYGAAAGGSALAVIVIIVIVVVCVCVKRRKNSQTKDEKVPPNGICNNALEMERDNTSEPNDYMNRADMTKPNNEEVIYDRITGRRNDVEQSPKVIGYQCSSEEIDYASVDFHRKPMEKDLFNNLHPTPKKNDKDRFFP